MGGWSFTDLTPNYGRLVIHRPHPQLWAVGHSLTSPQLWAVGHSLTSPPIFVGFIFTSFFISPQFLSFHLYSVHSSCVNEGTLVTTIHTSLGVAVVYGRLVIPDITPNCCVSPFFLLFLHFFCISPFYFHLSLISH